ncbi:DUF3305 domain-containing protein [Pseudorhodoplanes sp.]|uniref:DUF3305 domain-containing protein n=1 Tax=Pseudorhodoplanes sp. TaxID=1934341 RepID=UPI002C5A1E5A|nr:DUF3305 domain-containing protein [Pseudorhodoplanes sp.]HWV52128.1 DUF3305 domain-containing protein [Pseudorhodoplanes sp.]
MAALVAIPVGVVVERVKAESQWIDYIWQPSAVLVGEPEANPWTALSGDDDRMSFYAGSTVVEFYASETAHYRDNLIGDCKLWIVMAPTESDPPYQLTKVTADPAEGESYTETGVNLVEAVPMPDAIRDALVAFVSAHHVKDTTFFKRARDRADPEALGRRSPIDRRRGND